ncbi:MAG: ABC transporter permease [Chloroflexota bacterium]
MRRVRRFFSHWQNWLALLFTLGFIIIALAAPGLSPDNPKTPGPFMRVGRITESEPIPPGESEKAPLGMLPFGVDVYHALVWGARDALQFGLTVTLVTGLFGVLYGAIAGLTGGRWGRFMMNVADSFLALPVIAGVVFLQQLFASTIQAMGGIYFMHRTSGMVIEIVGPMTPIQWVLERVSPLMLSLIVLSWMPYARMVHSTVILLANADFVQAARALGGGAWWVIRKHLIPNSYGPAFVLGARDVGGVVLLQATFTFIGLGGDSVWGAMLSQGRNWVIGPGGSLLRYWWVFLPPTLAVMIFGIAWNMLGDGLSDALNPESS